MSGRDFLAKLREAFVPSVMPIVKCQVSRWGGVSTDEACNRYTIFGETLSKMAVTPEETEAAIQEYCSSDIVANGAVGAMVGQAIGDAIGAPLEFLDADESPFPRTAEDAKLVVQQKTDRESFFYPEVHPQSHSLQYFNVCNKFQLKSGQWTDDASMALCLADTMIVNGRYEGGDCRARYFNWWFHGYNNAFRVDDRRDFGRTSVGLGGNISKSIDDLLPLIGKASKDIPPRFEATGEDAGNGSIMRLSPVPVRYHSNVLEGMQQAAESSYATHPGPDAAACCRFITYFVTTAMHRKDRAVPMAQFLDNTIAEFKELVASKKIEEDTGITKLLALLNSAPPAPTEQCWNWRHDGQLEIKATLKARGRRYNGYPVIPGYFGSYCMDGLAMSLWAMRRTTRFSEAILHVVNLLGDCDTTGAICGQMVGAFYGYDGIASDDLGAHMRRVVHRWDPEFQWELRALWLYEDGCRDAAAAAASAAAPAAAA